MIEMKIELREPEEMRVAAKFLAEMAEASEAARLRRMADYGNHIAGAALQAQEQVQAATNPVQPKPKPAPKTPPKPAAKVEPVPELEPEAAPEVAPKPRFKIEKNQTDLGDKFRSIEMTILMPKLEEPIEEKATSTLTVEDLRAKAALLSKAGHSEAIKKILASYGVINMSAIPMEKHQEFNDRLEGLNG